MYAIVDVKDKQFKVREDDTLYVPYHSEADVDDTLTLDRVLLVSDGDGDVTLGTPSVEGATVTARVVDQVKGDKVIVFKKKRRKRYRVKRGHRQQYTQIQITSLDLNGAAPAADEVDETTHNAEAASDSATASDADTAAAEVEDDADADAAPEADTDVEDTTDTASEETADADDEADDEK